MTTPRGSSTARGYGYRWQKARLTFLTRHPLCAYCLRLGRTKAATVVDHIIPHRGDQAWFWDSTNWQALCVTCHDAIKQAQEKSGILRGCDTSGRPLDRRHHWNKPAP